MILNVTEPVRRFMSGIRYYPLDEPGESEDHAIVNAKDYERWLSENDSARRPTGSVAYQLLHLWLTQRDRFNELKSRLSPKGLNLVGNVMVSRVPRAVGKTGRPTVFYLILFDPMASPENADELLAFKDLSQGTRRLIRLLTAQALGDYSVMLLEHPEEGIHKGLVRKVAGLLQNGGGGQVVLSTHSDTLMNALPPESIRFVSMEDGATAVRPLSGAEREAASDYINSDVGGTLAEFLHSVED